MPHLLTTSHNSRRATPVQGQGQATGLTVEKRKQRSASEGGESHFERIRKSILNQPLPPGAKLLRHRVQRQPQNPPNPPLFFNSRSPSPEPRQYRADRV